VFNKYPAEPPARPGSNHSSGHLPNEDDKYGSSKTNLQSSFVTSLSDCECLDEHIIVSVYFEFLNYILGELA
jgi:hypothetical protein